MTTDGIGTITSQDPDDSTQNASAPGFVISPQQRRTWFLQRTMLAPYTEVDVEIDGILNVERLRRATERITQRHEILRTTFRQVRSRTVPVQVIHEALPYRWREIDLDGIRIEDQLSHARQFLLEDVETPFDVEAESPLRVSLARCKADKHLFSLSLPTLCGDCASLRILVGEIAALYAGREGDLDSEPLQYADVSNWQNQLLENPGEAEAGHAFWRQQNVPSPAIFLPFERKVDEVLDAYSSDSVRVPLDANISKQLPGVASNKETTPAAILAACWQVLLSRWSGSTDVLLYHVSNGRQFEDLQGAVGPLAKALPVCVTFDPATTTVRLWRRTNKAIQDAIRWEYYWNWEALAAGDGKSGFAADPQFGFTFEEQPARLSAGELCISLWNQGGNFEPFKLHLVCQSSAEELSLQLHYDPRRYAPHHIQRLATSFATLLNSALANPDAPTAALDLLPPDERHHLLVECNHTHHDFPPVVALHHLFEQAAHAFPHAPALVCQDQTLSYDQLNQRANQLAHTLLQHGLGPDTPVALYLERSPELVVGMLAILKAGAAYLPLDPALPKERLRYMLEDSRAPLLLTDTTLAPRLDADLPTLLLDAAAPTLQQQSALNPEAPVAGSHLVYVIYTSGSTGRPKGVLIEHAQLLNYVQGVLQRLNLPQGSHFASVSTFAADLGHTAVFGALCSGGCLHLLSSACAMDPGLWQDYFSRHRLDCLKIVPSHLQALLSGGVTAGMLPRQVLVLGGEASRWEFVERIREAAPGLRVLNHYGPTETTVGVLTYEVGAGGAERSEGSGTVPLGRPLPNSRVYVLNAALAPVPQGVAGEVFIGGSGVGRGYLNQPELTRERFVADPFCGEAGARLYRTGDLGRYLPTGDLAFLGRVDHQVKVRGHRIELGEIESVLLSHGGVREAVVVAREEVGGGMGLVGYVVGSGGEVAVGQLRGYLAERVPEVMVPGVLVVLSRLPLTANGKVDRGALPSPESVVGEVVGPRNSVERVLVELWGELLGRGEVSVLDSFFELGGHSLLATQVISRVRETFQVDVPLRALFDAPTIASFADLMLLDPATRPQIESMAEALVSLSGLSDEELEERLKQVEANGDETWK